MAPQLKTSTKRDYYFVAFIQFLVIAVLPPFIFMGPKFYEQAVIGSAIFNSVLLNLLALYFCRVAQKRFESHPQGNPVAYIIPIALTVYGIIFTFFFVTRYVYSVKLLWAGLFLTIIFLVMLHATQSRARRMQFFVVPLGGGLGLQSTEHYKFKLLARPALPHREVKGIVADFHSSELTPEWERFLAQCALRNTPIYNVIQLQETMTGRVDVAHLIENNLGDLTPPKIHQALKRGFDLFFLLVISPVAIPLMLIVALWISLDSPGGPFFIQKRMGLNGKHFNVLKFRSMTINHGGSHFTEENENHRITKVGRIIRKYRIDELPQFWNVIKGEMSLIGPRPESAELAKWYEKEVPFFAYRHVVRPGISGWAQVMHGYVAGVDEMKEKLAYDFYYIKHFSMWLDLLIWYKTIRTVLTGFGSR